MPSPRNERQVRLFRNGSNQAIRIPREFELQGEEVLLRKEGKRLIIESVPQTPLLSFLEQCEPLDMDSDIDADVDFSITDDDLPALDDIKL